MRVDLLSPDGLVLKQSKVEGGHVTTLATNKFGRVAVARGTYKMNFL